MSTVALALVAVVPVVAFLAATVGPLYAADRFRETRPPTDAERRRLDALREEAGLDVERVAVFSPSGGQKPDDAEVSDDAEGSDDPGSVEISVRGPPGRRVLFLTPGVFDLEDGTATALLAAEAGRLVTYYNEFRAVATAAVLALLAAVVTTLVPFEAGFSALAAVGFVAFWAGRRVQYAADARAADRVGAETLADAFERAAALRGVEPETGTWRTWFEVQPPLGDRIARLRER
ncbi:hypothetical protein [Haloparvum sedimenti]|uniref:hypothetical protein n=1 Tax=Haloparvum sedimenti TaxID=1678448 RepID=UPI00071E8D49|nr:hypothetical protein [Haloparvum sedimenti]